jgi:uncharacterized protein (DUF427 family)
MNKPMPEPRNRETATESVWDYPRPPRLEPTAAHLLILAAGETLADTTRALRLLETSHPPVYYIPPADIAMQRLVRSPSRSTFCEFKGSAIYWSLTLPRPSGPALVIADVAWSYQRPATPYAALKDHLAFYASRVDECWVDGERVLPQPGDFYGGWITSNLRGPFKGGPGTRGW